RGLPADPAGTRRPPRRDAQPAAGPQGGARHNGLREARMSDSGPPASPFLHGPASAFGKPVCRLGLACRGDSALTPHDVHFALGRGVNFLNTPGGDDAVTQAVAGLGPRRDGVTVCAQFEARTAADAATELRALLVVLKSDYVDVLTFYYVEQIDEWQEL